MASPQLQPIALSNAASGAANASSHAADSDAGGAQLDIPEHSFGNTVASAPAPNATRDFCHATEDALRLLLYAAEMGKEVDDTTRSSVLRASIATRSGWDGTVAANLLAALTKLSALASPVTAESLKAYADETKPTIRSLRKWTIWLAIPIIVFSVLGFVSSAISNVIRTDITTANDLVAKLRPELGTKEAPKGGTPDKSLPEGLNEGEVITQLQQYASTIRAIDARSRQLNWFVFRTERDPFAQYRWSSKLSTEKNRANQDTLKAKFQLPVGLSNKPEALDNLTVTYQDVRSFAQNVLDLVSVYYGAVTTCLLPVLYALLGACAYLLRSFEEELKAKTFIPSRSNWARFLIAGIGGAVVGLFGNFSVTQGASISPLAIAFLVGYAADVFFSFLEGMLQTFNKRKSSTSSLAAEPSSA